MQIRRTMENYHLSTSGEGWQLTAEGIGRTLDVFRTREAAMDSSEEIIRQRHGGKASLRIYRKDGTIEEERTYPLSATRLNVHPEAAVTAGHPG